MKAWLFVLGGALVGSGVVLPFFLIAKKNEFDRKANELRAQLLAQGGTNVYAQQLNAMRHDLETYVDQLAHRAADDHIGRYYGLTPERMANISRLARQLGV